MGYETRYRTVTKYRTRQKDLGFELIPTCRPKFIFFQFEGLRPSTPHWLFFDGKQITNWVNTSYTLDDFNDESRNSDLRNPGDKFLNATGFPDTLGGPTAASGPINSDATGKLEGLFYLQSNTSLSFPAGKRSFAAIDISVLKQEDALSYATAQYSAVGENELYFEYQEAYQTTEAYTVYVPDPPSSNNDDSGPKVTHTRRPDGGVDISFEYDYGTVTHHHNPDGSSSSSKNY